MRTDYEDLSEDEKESDRKWARIVLKVFKERMTELEDVYDTGIEKRWERLRQECTLLTEGDSKWEKHINFSYTQILNREKI